MLKNNGTGAPKSKLHYPTSAYAGVRKVIEPLSKKFPDPTGGKGFSAGRLHSFRHAFCSTCANQNVPERMVMQWLGHQDSAMIRHYYHLHDEEARRRMDQLNLFGMTGGRSDGAVSSSQMEEPSSRNPEGDKPAEGR